ncbi:MAG: hypothetical protein AAFR59_14775, partial [Bacteroidota bacterium]
MTRELEEVAQRQQQWKAQMAAAIRTEGQEVELWDLTEGKRIKRPLIDWATQWENLPAALEDTVSQDAPIQTWAEQLFHLLEKIPTIDLQLTQLFLPAPEHLPHPDEVNQRGREVNQWRAKVDGKAYQHLDDAVFSTQVQTRWEHVKEDACFLQKQTNLWTAPDFSIPRLQMALQRADQIREKIATYPLPDQKVDISPLAGYEMTSWPHVIVHLRGKFNRQGKLPLLKKKSLSPKEKMLLDCTLNGQRISHPEELEVLNIFIKRRLFEQQLVEMGQTFVENAGAKNHAPIHVDSWKKWRAGLQAYERVAKWNQYIAQWHLAPLNPFEDDLDATLAWWDGLPHCRAYQKALHHFRALETRIPQTEASHPTLIVLKKSLETLDGVAYQEAYTAYLAFTQEVAQAREL